MRPIRKKIRKNKIDLEQDVESAESALKVMWLVYIYIYIYIYIDTHTYIYIHIWMIDRWTHTHQLNEKHIIWVVAMADLALWYWLLCCHSPCGILSTLYPNFHGFKMFLHILEELTLLSTKNFLCGTSYLHPPM